MAIYHLSAQIIGRSQGKSAVNCAAYRAAEHLHDERLGKDFSYERKLGVEHKEIIAPENSPTWVHNREQLWNQVEAAEKRKDAQVAREVQISLPNELNHDQQVELVRGYVREQFVSKGMIADFAIHRDNPDNQHAHIMLTTRTISPEGFGLKCVEWNQKELLLDWRQEWATHANRALQKAGHHIAIDHRSYKVQGIDLEPQSKIGTNKNRIDGRDFVNERVAEHENIARRNGEAILKNPEIALHAITHQRATFTPVDVGRWLATRTHGAEQFQKCLVAIMASPEVVVLGKDAQGNQRLTTREMLLVEQRMIESSYALAEREGHAVSPRLIDQAQKDKGLSDDQEQAFRHVVQSGDLAIVQGYAGSGKSYMLGVAREAWEAQGYQVVGGALAGKAAEGLEISAGIYSRSLHSWEAGWRNGFELLTDKHVFVIDEAGMVGSRQLDRVIQKVKEAGAKVVLVGDTRQLQAIEAGSPMRAIAERMGHVTMSDIRRQKDDWQKEISKQLAQGRVSQALDAYHAADRIHRHATQDEAKKAMVETWQAHRLAAKNDVQIMLAFLRDDVRQLNELARAKRKEAGELGPDCRLETANGPREFAKGDRVYFGKNNRQLGVMNGSLGTVEAIRGAEVQVRLDDGREVGFDIRQYNHLDHGYAATAHKAQGMTVDRAHVLADTHFDQHVSYVALTRHRHQVDLHWSKELFTDPAALKKTLGRERIKDLAVDFKQAEKDAVEFARRVRQAPEKQPVENPLERARREFGSLPFAELHNRYQIAQKVAAGELGALPQHLRGKFLPERAIVIAQDALKLMKPYYEQAQREQEALLAKQRAQALHGEMVQNSAERKADELAAQRLEREATRDRRIPREPVLDPEKEQALDRQLALREEQWALSKDRAKGQVLKEMQLSPEKDEALRRQIALMKLSREVSQEPKFVEREPAKVPQVAVPRTPREVPLDPEREQAIRMQIAIMKPQIEGKDTKAVEQKLEKENAPIRSDAKQLDPSKAVAPDRYASLSLSELSEKYRELEKRAAGKSMTAAQAFEKMPNVVEARAELASYEKNVARCRLEAERFAKEHPIKTKMGIEPVFKDSSGREVKLSVGTRAAEELVEKSRATIDRLEKDPTTRKQAERFASEHNQGIDSANRELGAIKPHYVKAQAARELRIEERAKEIKEKGLYHDKDRGHGHGMGR